MEPDVNEDLIEATIRRVAQSKAARVPEDGESGDFTEPGVQVSRPDLHLVDAAPDAADAPIDEDPIEATIRRVAAAQASRAADAEVEAIAPSTAFDGEPTFGGVDDAGGKGQIANSNWDAGREGWAPDPTQSYAPVAEVRAPAYEESSTAPGGDASHTSIDDARAPSLEDARGDDAPAEWSRIVRELEAELRETRREVHALSLRVADLERDVSAPAPHALRPAATPRVVDEFDDAPAQVTRMSFGAPPRPAVMRDPSPQTATAEHLVPAYDEPEHEDPGAAAPVPAAPAKRGMELLPRSYRITVEDKRRGVDLVPLHRALLGMDGVRDMSLLSYSNGVAIISIDTLGGIDPEALRSAVSRAMAREAAVEVHNEQTMVVKLAEE